MIKPGVTLHRLELFLAVLDTGGVGRAAQARRLSQPAVSEHLRGLEAFFGIRLFERAGRGVRSTAAARQVEPFVRQALGLLRSAKQAAVELTGLQAGAVAVGASTTPGTYLLPSALGRFHNAHPSVALTLRIGDTREVEQWVLAGSVELGVIEPEPVRVAAIDHHAAGVFNRGRVRCLGIRKCFINLHDKPPGENLAAGKQKFADAAPWAFGFEP